MARLRDPSRQYDLVIWDTEAQGRALDEAFDKGRYRAAMPTLLLLERLYPWVAAQGRRPGSLDYLVKPVSPDDVAAAADQNVRVVKARRYVEYMRQQVLEVAELLSRTKELLGPTGYGVDRQEESQRLPLSDREEEIARSLAKGHRVTQIAKMLKISPHTVRNHFKSIFRKMQVHSQVELLARLREQYQDI
jgi:DNA-binding NarL/FixJ family response regulator